MHLWYGDWAKTKIESIFSSFSSAYRLMCLFFALFALKFIRLHARLYPNANHSFIHDHSHTKPKSHKLSAGI